MDKTISEILDDYGEKIVNGLRQSMQDKGLMASGDTARSIEYKVEENAVISLTVLAHLALIILETGRGPNKGGGKSSGGGLRAGIERWVETKPIIPFDPKMTKDQLVFLIVRKIAREGIKVPNRFNPGGVITDVIDDNLIEKINREVINASVASLVTTVKKAIKTHGTTND